MWLLLVCRNVVEAMETTETKTAVVCRRTFGDSALDLAHALWLLFFLFFFFFLLLLLLVVVVVL